MHLLFLFVLLVFAAGLALLASAQLVVIVVVLRWYPETAHQELEALNPEDAGPSAAAR